MQEVPNRAPPFPLEVVQCLSGYGLFKEQPLMTLSILLAFFGLLRTGELLSLQAKQVSISKAKGPAVISLGLTKAGKRQGAAESVTIYSEDVCRRLFQWVQTHPPHAFLTGPAHLWRKTFSAYLSACGFAQWDFRPYSLRRGGATDVFKKQPQFDKLLVLGRWQSAKTARVYLNEGMAVLAELKLPWSPLARNMAAQYLKSLCRPLPPLEPSPKVKSQGKRKGTTKKSTQKAAVRALTGRTLLA